MKQPGITRLFIMRCIAVLLAAYGVGLGVRTIRFARIEERPPAAAETKKPVAKPVSAEDEIVADTVASSKPSEEWAEKPHEEPGEEFSARAGHPEGERMVSGEIAERFPNISEEQRATIEMAVETARAQIDQLNLQDIQERLPALAEQAREAIRDIQDIQAR